MRDNFMLCCRTKFQTITAVIVVFLVIICYALSSKTPIKSSEKAANSRLSGSFQETLDAFQKQYGFPGATAAYVLRNGTIGIASTGLADW